MKNRNTGIELYKILAMFLIIISHVVQTLIPSDNIINVVNTIDLAQATSNLEHFILIIFRYFGAIGNTCFIIASSYFLIDNDKVKKEKIIKLILTNFIIYFIFMIISILNYNIPLKLIIKSLLPTLFEMNWFITCYIIFYMLHKYLNIIINNINKKEYFNICLILLIIYSILIYLKGDIFYINSLFNFIIIYFIVGYLKKYSNLKNNKFILFIGISSFLIFMLSINYMGLNYNILNYKMLNYNFATGIFNLLIGISLFNIFKNIKIQSKIINYISSLTLLIYLIHENLYLRTIYRPLFWNIINKNNTNYIVIKSLIYSILLFIISIVLSIIYNVVFNKIINYIIIRICKIIENISSNLYKKINKLLYKY